MNPQMGEGIRCRNVTYAILVQAVEDYHEWVHVVKPTLRKGEDPHKSAATGTVYAQYLDALLWFNRPRWAVEPEHRATSFMNVCFVFGIDPDQFRAELKDPEFVNRVRNAGRYLEKP